MAVGHYERAPKSEDEIMALRDFWRGEQRDQQRTRNPLDPLSRDSWRNEADARYGAHPYSDRHDANSNDEQRQFNDRWQNSYSGPGYGRFETPGNYSRGENRDESYGGSDNPFLGDHPLTRAGSAYESDYFAGNGIPATRDRPQVNRLDVEGEPSLWSSNQSATGQHRGRGPRGYQRSDERIKEDVCQCLTDDHHIDATDIEVAVRDREVILTGKVSTRAQKRHAEDLIERLPGVRDVINSLRVESQDSTTTPQQANWR
jgi:hypothetical protein